MQPDLLWNVGGIPPEAREAARAAARREGMPVGEWLTRRILRPASAAQPDILALPESWRPNPAANADGYGSIDALHCEKKVARPSERPQGHDAYPDRSLELREEPRSEPWQSADTTAQSGQDLEDPAGAITQLKSAVAALAERQRQYEQRSANPAFKDAVIALHAGLSKLNEQTTQASRLTGTQINDLSQRVGSLSSKIELTNCQMEISALQVKDELAGLDRRIDQLERLNLGDATAALRGSIRDLGAKVIEAETLRAKQLRGLKKGLVDLGTHIAHSNVDQKIAQLDQRVSELSRSGDRALIAQKLSDELARLARRLDSAEAIYRQDFARLQERLNSTQPQTPSSRPDKGALPEFDLSALTQILGQSEPQPILQAAPTSSSALEVLPSSPPAAAFGDFALHARQPAPKKERPGMWPRRTAFSAVDSVSDKIRLRNIAITSITVLLFALVAAYFLYHSRALASPLPSQNYLASVGNVKVQTTSAAMTRFTLIPHAGAKVPTEP
jgi:localization factor PodJL